MRLSVAREAQAELRQALAYYRSQAPGIEVQLQFVNDVEKAYRVILSYPKAGRSETSSCRRCLLSRFPYKVVYRVTGTHIKVIALAHLKMKPGYWKVRL